MAILDNGLKGNILTGLGIGVGVALLGPILIPVVASIAKPLAKAVIKGGVILYEKGKEAAAEAGEVIEDLVAETKAELAQAQSEATTVAAQTMGSGKAGEA
jgi:hypothetical protein